MTFANDNAKRSLAYITTRVFWPPKSGHEVHIYNYCRALHKQFGYDIDAFVFGDKVNAEALRGSAPEFLRQVIVGEDVSAANVVLNMVSKGVLSRVPWTLQSLLYYSKANCAILDSVNREADYDVFFVDMVRLAPYLDALPVKPRLCVLDMGDMLSKRYFRQIESISADSNVGGAFSDKLPGPLRRVLRAKAVQAAILKGEGNLMRKAERYWAERYDKVILVSTVETEELNALLGEDKAVTVRVGTDCDFFGQRSPKKGTGLVSFVGDMRTAANSDTVKVMVERILPLCRNVRQMLFVGRCPDGLKDLYRDNPKVRFTGVVDDIRDAIKGTNVFLAPMAYGTGVKIKVVEAMAMAMPVVTNSIGAEGIPATDGVHWLRADEDADIAANVDILLADPARCDQMGAVAQALARETYSWQATTAAFREAGL